MTDAGKDKRVTVTLEVTSKAGVGRGTWERETEGEALYLGEINATLSASDSEDCGGSIQLSYSGRYTAYASGPGQPFAILEVDDSGLEGGLATGYGESGSGRDDVFACGTDPGCSTTFEGDPDVHGGLQFEPDGSTVAVEISLMGWRYPDDLPCSTEFENLGHVNFPRSQIGDDTIVVDLAQRERIGSLVVHRSRHADPPPRELRGHSFGKYSPSQASPSSDAPSFSSCHTPPLEASAAT